MQVIPIYLQQIIKHLTIHSILLHNLHFFFQHCNYIVTHDDEWEHGKRAITIGAFSILAGLGNANLLD